MNWLIPIATFSALSVVHGASNRNFPDGFSFGVATASYQIEGGWNEDGKGENIWDHMCHTNPSFVKNNDSGDVACDSYHKYKEDVQLAASMGVKHYRLSISWSRILPTGFTNQINQKGIDYYQNVLKEIKKYNMTAMVTLYHWDLPQPLQDIGGWTNPYMVTYFTEYARVVISALEGVEYWLTINEPRPICRYGYGQGVMAPGITLDGEADYLCAYVLLKSHAAVYHMFKDEFPTSTAKMAITIDGQWSEPASTSQADMDAAERSKQFEFGIYANPIFNGNFPQVVIDRVGNRSTKENFVESRLPKFTQEEIDYIKGTFDFMGFNHYTTSFGADAEEEEYGDPSYDKDMRVKATTDPRWTLGANGDPIVPWGIRKYLKWIKDTYNNPEIFITENGVSDEGITLEDDVRSKFFEDYLIAVLDAIYEDDVKVIAYTAWSLLDNFEWAQGYSQHFGLFKVDFDDKNRTRTAKKSVGFYTEVAKTLKIPETSNANSLNHSTICSFILAYTIYLLS